MANTKKEPLSDKEKAQQEKMHAKMQRERQKAAKKRERDRAKQARDAERYEKQAAEARKKAAEARALEEQQKNDPAYQAKKKREEERLKEKGRREIERKRKRAEKKAAAAAKSKEKMAASGTGLAGAARRSSNNNNASRNKSKDAMPNRKRGSLICLIAMLVLAIAAAIMLFPPQDKITMGLDIQGGLSVNLSASTTDGTAVTQEQMDEAQKVITSRVNSSGASAATVQQQGTNSFLVQVPGAKDSQSILNTLSSQGVLEFVVVDDLKDETVKGYITSGITGMNLKDEGVEYEAFMTGDNVNNVTVDRPQGSAEYAVNLSLDSEGTSEFGAVTKELVSTHGQIAILLDGNVECAPAVQAAITTGQVQITGNYTSQEANDLKAIIDSGSLPVSLNIEQSSTVGPTLGQSALKVGIISAAIGIALVIIWMLIFYSGLGLLPACSLILMAIIYLGLLAMLSQFGWFSLTLPGIAGIIVNIGMAADSSILIMECFHEQIREGKSLKTASKNGVHEGIFTSIDADVVTLVSALVLYFLAMGDVRGFGLTLALGIICDLVVMALFSGPIMRILGPKVMAKHPGFWGLTDDINEGEYLTKEVR